MSDLIKLHAQKKEAEENGADKDTIFDFDFCICKLREMSLRMLTD